MSIRHIIPNLNNLLGEGKLTDFFKVLSPHFDSKFSKTEDLRLLQSQWSTLDREYYLNKIDLKEFLRLKTEIVGGLQWVMSSLDTEFLNRSNEIDSIEGRLLLLTPTSETEKIMIEYLPFERFPERESVLDETYKDPKLIESIKIIVFDHFKHLKVKVESQTRIVQIAKLQWLLTNTKLYVIWFGTNNEIVEKNNARIYAVDSPFALYSRIREMLNFLKYYRGGQ